MLTLGPATDPSELAAEAPLRARDVMRCLAVWCHPEGGGARAVCVCVCVCEKERGKRV